MAAMTATSRENLAGDLRDVDLSFPTTFRNLLVQLGKEHERETTMLENEIHALRAQLSGCTQKVETQLATNDNFSRKQADPSSGQGPLLAKGLSLESKPSSRPAFTQNQSLESSGLSSEKSPAIPNNEVDEAQPLDRNPTLDLSLTDLPEELYALTEAVEYFGTTVFGRLCGMTQDRVDKWTTWWKNLREVERPSYCGLRNFVDGSKFANLIAFCICLNTAYILYTAEKDIQAVQEDPASYHTIDVKKQRLAIDLIFAFIYIIELALKLFVHRWFLYLAVDWRWNVFDTCLVIFSVFDVCVTVASLEERTDRVQLTFLRCLRIIKVSKVMRMIRAIRSVQELRLMLECVLTSFSHLLWCIILIVLVLVLFAVLLVQGVTASLITAHKDNPAEYETIKSEIRGFFDSLPNAMLSLFKSTTGGEDWQDFYVIIADTGSFYAGVFLFYIAFFCIVAWNIVMSTFVERTFKLSVPDMDSLTLEKRKKDLCYSKELFEIINRRLNKDQNNVISLAEFKEHINDPELRKWFETRDFDLRDAELFFHLLASSNKHHQVDVTTFVMGCMRLRGNATSIDMQNLHYDIRTMHRHSKEQNQRLADLTQQIINRIEKTQDQPIEVFI